MFLAIARDRWVGPDVDHGAIRTDAGQRQRRHHVDVGGKAGRGIARRAAEHEFVRGGSYFDMEESNDTR